MNEENISELHTIWDEARRYIESGNRDKAIEIYKYILLRYGDDVTAAEHAHAYLGDMFLTSQQLDLAEYHIKKAITYKPEKSAYRYILGFVHSYRRRWDNAISEFEIAVRNEPKNGEYLRGLGWAIYNGGDRQQGLIYLQKAKQMAPNNTNILTDLAVAYLATDINQSKKYAQQAITIDPTNALARDVLGSIRNFSEMLKRSGKAVERVTTNIPKRGTSHDFTGDGAFLTIDFSGQRRVQPFFGRRSQVG